MRYFQIETNVRKTYCTTQLYYKLRYYSLCLIVVQKYSEHITETIIIDLNILLYLYTDVDIYFIIKKVKPSDNDRSSDIILVYTFQMFKRY